MKKGRTEPVPPSADSGARSAELYMKSSHAFRVLAAAILAVLLPVTARVAFGQHMGGGGGHMGGGGGHMGGGGGHMGGVGGAGSHHSMGGPVRGGPPVSMGNRFGHDGRFLGRDGRFFNNHRFAHNDHFFDHRFDHHDRFFHHHRNIFIFDFVSFGFPWWYPYPYYYGYPYDYYPYDYYPYDYSYSDYGPAYDEQYWNDLATSVQSELARRGYYSGSVDGVIGRDSRRAIRAFQAAQGLPVTGIIDAKSLKALGIKYRTA